MSGNSEIKECLSQLNIPGAKGKTHSNDGHRMCKTLHTPDTNTPIYWIAFQIKKRGLLTSTCALCSIGQGKQLAGNYNFNHQAHRKRMDY